MSAVAPSVHAATGRRLLVLAREAISEHLRGLRGSFRLEGEEPELTRPAGAFVTLWRRPGRELRGCVGYVEPRHPLAEAVRRAAVLAATEDGRFLPLTLTELAEVGLEVSVLGPLEPVRPDEVVLGQHGLRIQRAGRSGLLLPKVPLEHGWGREGFLDHLCLKAGLAEGDWRRPDAGLEAFTATVFSED